MKRKVRRRRELPADPVFVRLFQDQAWKNLVDYLTKLPVEPIPAGTYVLQVIETKIEDTKRGKMLVLTLEVVDGEYTNRLLWDRLHVISPNPDEQRFAQQALCSLCRALGITELTNSEALHFRPFEAKVRICCGPENMVAARRPHALA